MNEISEQELHLQQKPVLLREIDRLKRELNRLEIELGDAKKALAEEQSGLKNQKDDEIAALKNELDLLSKHHEEAKERIRQLNLQLDSAVNASEKQNEEMRILREKLNSQTQAHHKQTEEFEQKISELKTQIADLQKVKAQTESASAMNGETEAAKLKDSKSTFIIDLYPYQESYRGKITHALSNTREKLNEINGNQIIKFINKFLPQALDNGVSYISRAYEIKDMEGNEEKLSFEFPSGTIKIISFQQPDVPEMRKRLKTGKPIELNIDCSLPASVVTSQVMGHPLNFHITIKDQATYKRTIETTIEEKIELNKYRYLTSFHIDQLAHGSYSLDVYLHAPNCGISEYKSCTIMVIS